MPKACIGPTDPTASSMVSGKRQDLLLELDTTDVDRVFAEGHAGRADAIVDRDRVPSELLRPL